MRRIAYAASILRDSDLKLMKRKLETGITFAGGTNMLKRTKQVLMIVMVILNVCILTGSFLPHLNTFEETKNFYNFFPGAYALAILIPLFSLLCYLFTIKVPWLSALSVLLYSLFIFVICFGPSLADGFAKALGGVRSATAIGYYIMLTADIAAALLSYLRLAVAIAEHAAGKGQP